ncbi:MAG TPA: protein kinase [Gemmatimonadaceae bacterium]
MALDLRDRLQSTLGDNYTIERELGGGGMSRVFVANEIALGRQVVVKILGPELASEISGERFAREVRLAASLQHPNIVPVLTTGVADGIPYYTMPFVRGESLRARMRELGTLPVRQVISILRDIARALQYAHAEGVVHRDIKPENVLLAGDAAVVTDFGIAKAISVAQTATPESGEHTPTTLTQAGISIGTPAYMSPEQAAGDVIDHRADIYAWGVIAYEMLAGVHPFADKATAAHMMAAQISQMPQPLNTASGRIPVALANLVMQCLAKAPGGRPPSAGDLIDMLDASRESRDHPTIERKSLHKRRIPRTAIVGVLALILIAGGYFIAKKFSLTSGTAAINSVAVLPFTHEQSDSAEAYFGEGIADELMTALAKVPGLRVASRTSAIAMGSRRDLDVREIAQKLGVSSIVEGTVRRYGGKLRVSAQLTNATDGLTMWSEAYDRESKDVFDVQADITNAIVAALRPSSAKSFSSRSAKGPGTSNAEAYDFYLRGLYLVERRGQSVKLAADYFSKAIEKDPGFARAYAELAAALELFPYFAGVPAYVVEPRARAAAERALQLDPSLAEARVALAMAHWHAFRWNDADREFERAIASDSTSAVAHTQYGRYLLCTGRVRESIPHLRIAQRLDPLAPTSTVWLSGALLYEGQRDASIAESRRSRELDPNLMTNRTVLVYEIVRQGKIDEAISAMKGDIPPVPFNGQTAHHMERLGDKAGAAGIRKSLMEMPDSVWMVHLGRVWALLGINDTSRALTELEKAVDSRETIASWLPLEDHAYDSIRESPRFAAVIKRIGLEGRGLTNRGGGRPSP